VNSLPANSLAVIVEQMALMKNKSADVKKICREKRHVLVEIYYYILA